MTIQPRDGWTVAALPDLIGAPGLITDGDWVESKDQDPDGSIRLTQLADVGDGSFRDRSKRFLRPDQAQRLGCTFLEVNDVMVARMPDPLGRACLYPGGPQPAVTVVDVCVIRLGGDEVSPRWLMHFINAPQFRSLIAGEQRGSTRKRVSKKNLCGLELPFPPSSEQERIADLVESYLSRVDDAVANLERVQTKLKAYRASVLKAAVEGRLVSTEAELARKENQAYEPAQVLLARILRERRRRWEEAKLAKLKATGKTPKDDNWKAKYEEPSPPDASRLPEPPEGWCWATVEQVGEVLLGRQRSPAYLTGTWTRPYLRVANIKDDRIEVSDVGVMDFDEAHYPKYRLIPGDILVSEGQSPHLVGQSAIYRGGIDGLCFQKTLHRFRAVPGGPQPEFAQIVFRANVKLGIYKALAPITTNIAHLTLEKFKASRFPLAPEAEQERITVEVDRLLSIADVVEGQVVAESLRIGRLRQAILKWAFEGKLVDQDPNDEPAKELLARIRAERAQGLRGSTNHRKRHRKRA